MVDFNTVDPEGNIQFALGEGVSVSFRERSLSTGAYIIPANHPRFIYIPKLGIDRQLLADLTYYYIQLTVEDLHPVGMDGVVFSILDREGSIPISLWNAIIRERNPYYG